VTVVEVAGGEAALGDGCQAVVCVVVEGDITVYGNGVACCIVVAVCATYVSEPVAVRFVGVCLAAVVVGKSEAVAGFVPTVVGAVVGKQAA